MVHFFSERHVLFGSVGMVQRVEPVAAPLSRVGAQNLRQGVFDLLGDIFISKSMPRC